MKKNLMVILFVVLVVGLTACTKQSVAPAPEPETKAVIEPNAFQVFDKMPLKMDAERALALGLHEATLDKPIRVFNYMGMWSGKVRWQPETLPTGTKVLIGEDGIPLYKRDCWNKLFVPVALQPVANAPAMTRGTNDFWHVAKIIGLILLGLIFLVLLWILDIIQRLARWLYEHRHGHDNPPAPRGGVRRTTTTPPQRLWMIHAEEGVNHRISAAAEGFRSLHLDTEGNDVTIRASRR